MSKHTVFVEAPPFAKFSDAEMRRLLDDERLEVLDWRGKRVDAPGFVEALAAADIAVTGNSLTITAGDTPAAASTRAAWASASRSAWRE